MANIVRLLPLSGAVLLSSLGTSIVNVALPTLAHGFDVPFQTVQWVVLAYLLSMTALVVGAGRLGDIFGRRRLLLAGLVTFTLASVGAAAAPDLAWLIAARAVQGAGAAVMMALGMALVGESVPAAETGSAMGLLGTMSAVGTALGPTLGGLLIETFGWRSVFLLNIPAGIAVLVMVVRHVPVSHGVSAGRTGFDVVGMIILAATLAAYALAMAPGRDQPGLTILALLACAAMCLLAFIAVEARTPAPLIPLDIFRGRSLGSGLFVNMIVSTVLMSTLVVGPFYLAGALGLNAALTGAVMSVGPILSALTGVPAGRLADRIGARRLSLFGLTGILSGCGLLAVLPVTAGVAGYAGPIAVITVSYALFQAANNTTIMKAVAMENRGVVSGLLNLSRNLGLVTGASAMGAVFAFGAGGVTDGAAVANGMHLSFTLSGALIVVALIVMARLGSGHTALNR